MSKLRTFPISEASVFIFSILGIFLSIRIFHKFLAQFIANLKAGYGFTDEGGPLIALNERAIHGSNSHTFTFVEPLHLFFTLSSQDIFKFRLIGLTVLIAIPVFFLIRNVRVSKTNILLLFFLSINLLLAVMTIPSVFRYLLVTPTYQWTILVNSFLLNIIFIGKFPIKSWTRILTILTVTFLIFGMSLSRPTSGLVGLLSVLMYLLILSKQNVKQALIVFASQLIITAIVLVFNIYNLRYRFLESIKISKSFDPNGYNVVSEIQDVLFSVSNLLVFSSAVFVCCQFVAKTQNFTPGDKRNKGDKASHHSLPVIALVFLFLIYSIPKIEIEGQNRSFLFSMILLNSILGAYLISFRTFAALSVLSYLPYMSQFGSNTPAIGNIQILFMTQTLLTLGIFLQGYFAKSSLPEANFRSLNFDHVLQLLTFLIFTVSLVTYNHFANSQFGNNFEKTLYPLASSKSPTNGLFYTPEKLLSLEKFSKDADLRHGEEVIDLSSYHPGLILYAGGIQSQRALPDKYWIYNIKNQVRFVMDLHGGLLKIKGTKILLESKTSKVNEECTDITNLIEVEAIAREIDSQGFNVKVRVRAIYNSFPEDLTLYPNNALLVETCEGP